MTTAPDGPAPRVESRGLLRSTVEHWRDFGARETLLAAVSKLMTLSAAPVLRRRIHPSLADLHGAARAVHLRPEDAARDIVGDSLAPVIDTIAGEYEEVRARLRAAYVKYDLSYPSDRRLGGGSSFLLYALVRGSTPGLVVETGIANGHSTFIILSALERNGAGRLVSIDVEEQTGSLLRDLDTARWAKRILGASRRRRSFESVISSLEPIDLFLHDSDHTYRWQRLEYRTVRPRMAASSLIASDDVDMSFAFLEFCREIGRRPTLLVEPRKVFGVVKPDPSAAGEAAPAPWDE